MNRELIVDDKDGYNWTLTKALSSYTQEELAHELMEYKKTTNIEPQIRIGGVDGEYLITVGLNTEKEFLDKYGSVLDRANIPRGKAIEEVLVHDITLEKPINNYTNLELAQLLINKKKESNEEYGVIINSKRYDTIDCVTYTDFTNKYHAELKQLGVKEKSSVMDGRIRNALLTEKGNFAKYVFKLPRGNIGSDGLDNNQLAEIAVMENEYKELFSKKDSIDFSNEKEVYDWLVSLSKYINTHAVNLGDYSTMYLLVIMKEHGYTSDLNANSYKYEIAHKLAELEDYNFFVCDEVYNQYDSNQTVLEAAKLEKSFFEERMELYSNGISKIDEKLEDLDLKLKADNANQENLKKELVRLESVKKNFEMMYDSFKNLLDDLKTKYNLFEEEKEEVEEELSDTKKLGILDKLKGYKEVINTISNIQDEENNTEKEEEEEFTFDIKFPEDDTLNSFTPIKSFRKITKDLYDKVIGKKFVTALTKVIENMHTNKKPVAASVGLAVGSDQIILNEDQYQEEVTTEKSI